MSPGGERTGPYVNPAILTLNQPRRRFSLFDIFPVILADLPAVVSSRHPALAKHSARFFSQSSVFRAFRNNTTLSLNLLWMAASAPAPTKFRTKPSTTFSATSQGTTNAD